VLFAVATAASMTLYALFAGYLAGRAARFAEPFGRAIGQFTGMGTVITGVIWLIR
jgi:hypothetical protein